MLKDKAYGTTGNGDRFLGALVSQDRYDADRRKSLSNVRRGGPDSFQDRLRLMRDHSYGVR